MAITGLDRATIDRLLYGGQEALRFTQDSPILPDVWMEFAKFPDRRLEMLLTPYQGMTQEHTRPGELSVALRERIRRNAGKSGRAAVAAALVAHNQTTVLAKLDFTQLIQVALPISSWWYRWVSLPPRAGGNPKKPEVTAPATDAQVEASGTELAERTFPVLLGRLQTPTGRREIVSALNDPMSAASYLAPPVLWMVRMIGTIQALREELSRFQAEADSEGRRKLGEWIRIDEPDREENSWTDTPPLDATWSAEKTRYHETVTEAAARLIAGIQEDGRPGEARDSGVRVYSVSLNRIASTTIARSRASIKADAAMQLFNIDCSDLAWAVLDSGIDATHPAFRTRRGKRLLPGDPIPVAELAKESRVIKTYDFTIIRHLLNPNVSEALGEIRKGNRATAARLEQVLKGMTLKTKQQLKKSLQDGREVDWDLLRDLIEVKYEENDAQVVTGRPRYEHGTHVACIIGGEAPDPNPEDEQPVPKEVRRGMCPDIKLYDLRVLDDNGKGSEFNVMAALQFVRHINSHKENRIINGVNLSISIRHEVANFACGRTPVCDECERLVGAGIVVVAAAGNEGYLQFLNAKNQPVESYRNISITDPGNAEGVITVGSTHRFQPHTYGVSYFSSRGPTGDGRAKPDLVAPGEKIESAVPVSPGIDIDGLYKVMDGTSMAAPHVSGAAALLIARHRELDGQPARIKQILCATATDLGRERYFQGAGMVDVLRAIQSV